MLRYKSTGEVHKDFHGLTCATLHYLIDQYGYNAMETVIQKTAQEVYKTIHEELKNGNTAELEEYWQYYMNREDAEFCIEKTTDSVSLIVKNCPALRHLVKLEQSPDHILCEATALFNTALTDGTPFEAFLEETGEFSCVQSLKKRKVQI